MLRSAVFWDIMHHRGNSVPTFRHNFWVKVQAEFILDFLTLEYGTDRLSRKVGTELSLYSV